MKSVELYGKYQQKMRQDAMAQGSPKRTVAVRDSHGIYYPLAPRYYCHSDDEQEVRSVPYRTFKAHEKSVIRHEREHINTFSGHKLVQETRSRTMTERHVRYHAYTASNPGTIDFKRSRPANRRSRRGGRGRRIRAIEFSEQKANHRFITDCK